MTDGLKRKYNITKADGRPVSGRYFVLKVDSKDPAHAEASRMAIHVYASWIHEHLPELAQNLWDAVHDDEVGSWDKWDQCIGDA